ncbi:MAG: glycine--tRNA ligase [Defluviitaleaceae bacterium]|nr:glycine--tRNA ligase [Defluviitaleaceae bacterium]
MEKTMEKITALCKSRGFVYPGSEIYGGLANSWDFGPLGTELKNNVKRYWWKKFVQDNPHNVGIDCAIMMNTSVWETSGHIKGFNDPLMDCRSCKERFRADNLIDDYFASRGESETAGGWDNARLKKFIDDSGIACPSCGARDFTEIRQFNMMFKTHLGVTDDSRSEVFLRPETAQGIFVNFKNVQRTSRKKIPFGIGQIGHAFRNEITPGNFIFRVREFEQMELEFFCEPGTDLEWFAYWKKFCLDWLKNIGIKDSSLRVRDHEAEELSFYSNATTDIEFLYPFGWGELWGIADRTDYDLKRHMESSGEDLTFFDPADNRRYIPYCVEPSLGVTRTVLALLCDAYDEETVGEDESGKPDVRTVLRLAPQMAPVKAAVFPLSKKLGERCEKLYAELNDKFVCEYDDAGSIGKRYRRQDEIGTPFCVTYDFQSVDDGAATVRERDGMGQTRVSISELAEYIGSRVGF